MMSRPDVILSSWLQRPEVEVKHFQIIIPGSLKWEIRDKLDQANVNERMLFPGSGWPRGPGHQDSGEPSG